jgi:hypothetical protein
MHRFNLTYVKKHSAEKALGLAEEKLVTAIGKPGNVIGLYNPLPFSRKDPLRLTADIIPDGIAVQRAGDRIITEPLSFDSMEMKKFAKRSLPLPKPKSAPYSFETDFYRVSADTAASRIRSIYDKIHGRELLDPVSPFALGEYVYVVTEGKSDNNLSYEISKSRGFTVEEGDVAFIVTRRGYEEQSGADVLTRFIFYKHVPDIDVELCYTNAVGLMGDFYDRYKKNVFFAFPFAVTDHRFFTQLAGGRAHSVDEKMEICPMDFTVIEEWLAVEGENGGIGIRSADMPVFHLSQINYNRFLSEPDFPRPHLYLYAASNRTNNLNLRTPGDCCGVYRLTVLPYAGHCEDTLPQWSRALAQPVLCGDSRVLPRLLLDAELRLMSCRADGEHSLLLRFAEESGKARENVKLTLPFAPTRAMRTTLNGTETEALRTDGSDVFFPISGGEYCTVRVYGNFTITPVAPRQEQIYDIFTVPVENSRAIVCFTKAGGLQASAFRIFGDGQLLAEKENTPEAVQTVELDCRPEHVEIETVL